MLVLISFQFSLYLMTSQGDHITIAALRWLYDIQMIPMSDLLYVRFHILGLVPRLFTHGAHNNSRVCPHKRKLYFALHYFPRVTSNVHYLFMGVDQHGILFCAIRGQYFNPLLFPLGQFKHGLVLLLHCCGSNCKGGRF